MENQLQVFKKDTFGQIRIILKNNEPWFVAKDIADILGYSETNAMTKRLETDEVISDKLEGMNMKSTLINESGFYDAVLGSEKPEAKQFKKWVTSEVLPSIRKHGMYMTADVIEEALNNPDNFIKIIEAYKQERNARIEAERKNAILMHVNKTYTATEIAKELGYPSATALNKKLNQMKIQYKQNETYVLYSKFADKGYVEIKQEVLDNGRVIYHRKWTQTGREFLINLLSDQEIA